MVFGELKMKDLAPNIVRQRLLVEGHFTRMVDEQAIRDYFTRVCRELSLRSYGAPIIHSPSGIGKDENQGFDAFIPLIDSGISLYVWGNAHFFSVVIYTCKSFDEKKAVDVTKAFFGAPEVAFEAF